MEKRRRNSTSLLILVTLSLFSIVALIGIKNPVTFGSTTTVNTAMTDLLPLLREQPKISVMRRIQEQLFVNYPLGNAFQVNTYTTDNQQSSAICTLANGDFAITWQSNGQDGSGDGIYAQLFTVDGTTRGSQFRVNTDPTSNQQNPAISALKNGGFVISWEGPSDGSANSILMKRFDASGVSSQGSNDYLVNVFSSGDQQNSALACLSNGNIIVIWESAHAGNGFSIYARRFTSNGGAYGGDFLINTNTIGNQQYPAISSLSAGGFVIVWQSSGQDGDGNGIYAQRFSDSAVKQGSEFQVNTFTSNDQQSPDIASLNDGGFVIVWQSSGQDGDGDSIYAQRYDASGVAQGSEFRVNTITGTQTNPAIIGLSDGGFVVTWNSNGAGVYSQRFDSNGSPHGNEFMINTYTTDNQQLPAISSLNDGRFVVSWQSNDQDMLGIYAQRFDGAWYQTPTLSQQPLTIYQGESLVFNNILLNASDSIVANNSLLFEVSDAEYCQFELVTHPGIAITNFTQQALIVGEIQFVHDGSIQEPSYLISVSNGYLSTVPQMATIYFTLALQSSSLFSSDFPAESSMIEPELTASPVQSNSDTPYEPSIIEPTASPVQSSSVSRPPWLVKIEFSIRQGETVVLSSAQFQASYGETSPDELVYMVIEVQHGRFQQINEPDKAITQFTQQQINNGEIQFVHDGSRQSPSFTAWVNAGQEQSSEQSSRINFTMVNKDSNRKGSIIGGVVGGVGGGVALLSLCVALAIAVVCFFAVKKRRKSTKVHDLEQGIEMKTTN